MYKGFSIGSAELSTVDGIITLRLRSAYLRTSSPSYTARFSLLYRESVFKRSTLVELHYKSLSTPFFLYVLFLLLYIHFLLYHHIVVVQFSSHVRAQYSGWWVSFPFSRAILVLVYCLYWIMLSMYIHTQQRKKTSTQQKELPCGFGAGVL